MTIVLIIGSIPLIISSSNVSTISMKNIMDSEIIEEENN